MELKQLQYFLSVAEKGSISRAAESTFVSQPAISKSRQQLEKELGVSLFVRGRKRMTLSDAGKVVQTYAEQVKSSIDAMNVAVSKMLERKTALRVLTNSPPIIRYFLPDFTIRNPETPLESQYSAAESLPLHALLDGSFDVIISGAPLTHPSIHNEPLFQETLALCVPKNSHLAERSEILLEDLDHMTLLTVPILINTPLGQNLQQKLRERGVRCTFQIQQDTGSLHYLMARSDACTISSALTMLFWQYPERKYIPLAVKEFYGTYYISYRTDCPPLVHFFRDWCVSRYGMGKEERDV